MGLSKLYALTIPFFKGIYGILFLLCFTSALFAQDRNWEIGIGVRPLHLKEDPYSFIAKKFLSRNTALRFGASFYYNQKNNYVEYIHPYTNQDIFGYQHFYTQTDKKLNATCFLGFQYGKRNNRFYSYGATDVSLRYKMVDTDIPSFSFNVASQSPGYINIKPGDFFTVASFSKDKVIGFTVHQSFGIQFSINTTMSLALEGGLSLERYYSRRYSFQYYATTELTTSTSPDIYGFVSGTQFYPLKKTWLYDFNISPLTFLIFIYQI